MKWEDMPEEKRPWLLLQTRYPEFYMSTGQTFESLPYTDRKIVQRDFRRDEGSDLAAVNPLTKEVVIGTGTTSADLGHELGHIDTFDELETPKEIALWRSQSFHEGVIRQELLAWKAHFKNKLRLGSIDIDEFEYAALLLASYIGRSTLKPGSRLDPRALKRARKLLRRAIREARWELKQEGEL